MRVFISWSGDRSESVAKVLQSWLPRVIQVIRPWLSSASIDPGARWSDEVADALQDLNFGVLCLTPENLSSAWLLFEAGALSKAVSESRVVPYLLNFEPHQLQGPLAQFQAVRADEAGTLRLVAALNGAAAERAVSPETLNETFELWWPKLARQLAEISSRSISIATPAPARSLEDMVGEALELLRKQRSLDANPSSARFSDAPDDFGTHLRFFRVKRMLSQAELAKRAALSPSFISRLEAGILKPSAETINRLSTALEIDVLEFPTQS